MGNRTLEVVLATTGPLRKYGDFRLSPSMLERFASELQERIGRWRLDHDERTSLAIRPVEVWVSKNSESGDYELRALLDADEAEWSKIGERRSFSVSFFVPLHRFGPPEGEPDIVVSGDAQYWRVEEVLKAAEAIAREDCSVQANLLFQLAIEPIEIAKVVLELSVTVLVSIESNALYDMLKELMLPKRRSSVAVSAPDQHPPQSELIIIKKQRSSAGTDEEIGRAILRTNDSELLRDAVDKFLESDRARPGVTVYDTRERRWIDPA